MPSAANTQARHQAQGSVTGNGFRLEAIQGVRTWRPFSSGSCDLILGPPARVHLDEFTAGKPWATNTPLPHNSATSLPPSSPFLLETTGEPSPLSHTLSRTHTRFHSIKPYSTSGGHTHAHTQQRVRITLCVCSSVSVRLCARARTRSNRQSVIRSKQQPPLAPRALALAASSGSSPSSPRRLLLSCSWSINNCQHPQRSRGGGRKLVNQSLEHIAHIQLTPGTYHPCRTCMLARQSIKQASFASQPPPQTSNHPAFLPWMETHAWHIDARHPTPRVPPIIARTYYRDPAIYIHHTRMNSNKQYIFITHTLAHIDTKPLPCSPSFPDFLAQADRSLSEFGYDACHPAPQT